MKTNAKYGSSSSRHRPTNDRVTMVAAAGTVPWYPATTLTHRHIMPVMTKKPRMAMFTAEVMNSSVMRAV